MIAPLTPGNFATEIASISKRLERSLKIGISTPSDCLRATEAAIGLLRAMRGRITQIDMESPHLTLHVHFASIGHIDYWCPTLADARRYYIECRNKSGDDMSREGSGSGYVRRRGELVARILYDGQVIDAEGKEIAL